MKPKYTAKPSSKLPLNNLQSSVNSEQRNLTFHFTVRFFWHLLEIMINQQKTWLIKAEDNQKLWSDVSLLFCGQEQLIWEAKGLCYKPGLAGPKSLSQDLVGTGADLGYFQNSPQSNFNSGIWPFFLLPPFLHLTYIFYHDLSLYATYWFIC